MIGNLFRKLLNHAAPLSMGEKPMPPSDEAENKTRQSSYFSTDIIEGPGDPVLKQRRITQLWDNTIGKLAKLMPTVPHEEGTAMDAAGDIPAIKSAYALSQPNISEVLMMWYVSQSFIGHQMCAFLMQHWLIEKVCSMPARDAVRKGYEIVSANGDELPLEILQEIRRHDEAFKLDGNMMEFLRMGRGFGVRILFFKVDSPDPLYYEKPFNIDGIRPNSYRGMVQVDPYWTAPMLDAESSGQPDSMHFYEPTWWMINGKKYHRTHLIIFRNSEVPDMLKPSYIYGGVPVPQQIMERVYAAERTANEGPLLAMTKRTTVYKTNISEAFANKAKFDQRMADWIATRDNQQVKLADVDDDMQQFDTALGDLDAVIMTQYQIVAAAGNVPATKLLGTSPKGFGAAGDYEISSYHEMLESLQANDLNPLIIRHHQLVVRSFIKPAHGIDPDLRAKWNSLDTPTATEEADIQLKQAQRDQALIDSGAIDGVDVRNRLIADPKSGYTGLQAAERPIEIEEKEGDQA